MLRTSDYISRYLREKNIQNSLIVEILEISYPTYLKRMKDDKWSGLQIKELKSRGIIPEEVNVISDETKL